MWGLLCIISDKLYHVKLLLNKYFFLLSFTLLGIFVKV